MQIEKKLKARGLSIPALGKPVANYAHVTRAGNLMFLAGVDSRGEKGIIAGKLGENITTEEAYKAAEVAVLRLLSALKAELGDLDKVKRIVKLTCFVHSTPDFRDLAKVSDGASDLLVALYGKNGKHARTTVGLHAGVGDSCVGMDMIVEI
jgi:enamine deaminase RidA (YjgF/YER057c/UK114 family)